MRSQLLRMAATTALCLSMALATGNASAQDANAEFEKGVRAFDEGKYAEAIALWEPLGEAGNVEALRNLAQLYRLGLGVQQSDAKAFELYEKAAERGLAAAQVNAAFLLLTGKGVEQDRATAATWFAKAADQGNALAQYNLGLMYEKGIGVDQSDELALELYQTAAEQGQKRAIARLESMEETIAETERLSGAEVATKVTEEGPAEKGLESILKSEGQRIASGANDAERAEMAEAFGAQGKKMTRPEKADIADGIAAEGEEMANPEESGDAVESAAADPSNGKTRRSDKSDGDATAANEDLSIVPMDKPLEFEALSAPKETSIPTYKPEAQNGVNIEPVSVVETAPIPEEPKSEEEGELSIVPAPKEKPESATVTAGADDAKTQEQAAAVSREPAPSAAMPSDPVAQVKMAEAAYLGGDFAKAVHLLSPLSESGMPIAQFWLGRLYNRGEGVPLDRTTAYALWRSASASGSSNAATALANLSGRLSPEEIAQAEQVYASMIQ